MKGVKHSNHFDLTTFHLIYYSKGSLRFRIRRDLQSGFSFLHCNLTIRAIFCNDRKICPWWTLSYFSSVVACEHALDMGA